MDGETQIIHMAADDQIQCVDADIVENFVPSPTVVLHQILPIPTAKQEGIIAGAAVDGVVSQPAAERIVPPGTTQQIGGIIACEHVVEPVSGAIDRCRLY